MRGRGQEEEGRRVDEESEGSRDCCCSRCCRREEDCIGSPASSRTMLRAPVGNVPGGGLNCCDRARIWSGRAIHDNNGARSGRRMPRC